MMKLLLIVALLSWAAPAQAALTYNPEKSADRQMAFWDSNHNGLVEPAEYERLTAAKFRKIDTDGDDIITHAEMMVHRYGGKASAVRRKDYAKSVSNLMKSWDANDDLIISREEYFRPVRAEFERLDLDHNQSVSRDELVAHWQKRKQELEQHKKKTQLDDD